VLALLLSRAVFIPSLQIIHLNIDGVEREATVYAPAATKAPAPVIFGFHGHGGNSRNAARSFDLQDAWPDAVVVYPEGLPTKTRLDPLGRSRGWSQEDSAENKDIKFTAALYQKVLNDYHGDATRVFAMGHSNGGQFMYVLWSQLPSKFAAFGSCEGAGALMVTLSPKPFFITIGDADMIVRPQLQHKSLDAAFKVDGSEKSGQPYGEKGTYYKGVQPVVYWAYHGGHRFPSDCVPTMMRFFQSIRPQ
jgi:polyhydroxybutyrate depolymerase